MLDIWTISHLDFRLVFKLVFTSSMPPCLPSSLFILLYQSAAATLQSVSDLSFHVLSSLWSLSSCLPLFSSCLTTHCFVCTFSITAIPGFGHFLATETPEETIKKTKKKNHREVGNIKVKIPCFRNGTGFAQSCLLIIVCQQIWLCLGVCECCLSPLTDTNTGHKQVSPC